MDTCSVCSRSLRRCILVSHTRGSRRLRTSRSYAGLPYSVSLQRNSVSCMHVCLHDGRCVDEVALEKPRRRSRGHTFRAYDRNGAHVGVYRHIVYLSIRGPTARLRLDPSDDIGTLSIRAPRRACVRRSTLGDEDSLRSLNRLKSLPSLEEHRKAGHDFRAERSVTGRTAVQMSNVAGARVQNPRSDGNPRPHPRVRRHGIARSI
jgi:hypothetical protein